jgi:hypothetical protein
MKPRPEGALPASKKAKGFHPLDPQPACRRRLKLMTPAARRSGVEGAKPLAFLDGMGGPLESQQRLNIWTL